MFSSEDLERIMEKINQFNTRKMKNNTIDQKEKPGGNGNLPRNNLNLNPSEILVIAGLLCGVLDVNSIFVDKDQNVEILLAGTLRRPTQMEKIMEQIGKCSFEEVMQAILNGFG